MLADLYKLPKFVWSDRLAVEILDRTMSQMEFLKYMQTNEKEKCRSCWKPGKPLKSLRGIIKFGLENHNIVSCPDDANKFYETSTIKEKIGWKPYFWP
jgi:hypothetical protein